jgi:hypothetical protein
MIVCLTCVYLQKKDPIAVWTAFQSQPDITELATFAQLILTVVANQAGCERTFSDLKIKQAQRQNRLHLEKLDKMTKVDLCDDWCCQPIDLKNFDFRLVPVSKQSTKHLD